MGLFSFGASKKEQNINWVKFTNAEQLKEFIQESNEQPVMFFKHSIRCSISSMALNRVESDWDLEDVTPVYLDLINFRNLSNLLAETFEVEHQSPQVILVKDGKSIYNASHNQISVASIKMNL